MSRAAVGTFEPHFEKPWEKCNNFDDNYNIDGIIFSPENGNYMQPVPKWKMHSTVDLEVKCLESGEQVISTCDGFTVNMEFTLTRTLFAEPHTPQLELANSSKADPSCADITISGSGSLPCANYSDLSTNLLCMLGV